MGACAVYYIRVCVCVCKLLCSRRRYIYTFYFRKNNKREETYVQLYTCGRPFSAHKSPAKMQRPTPVFSSCADGWCTADVAIDILYGCACSTQMLKRALPSFLYYTVLHNKRTLSLLWLFPFFLTTTAYSPRKCFLRVFSFIVSFTAASHI